MLGWVAERFTRSSFAYDSRRRGHELASHGFSHELVYRARAAKGSKRIFDARSLYRGDRGRRPAFASRVTARPASASTTVLSGRSTCWPNRVYVRFERVPGATSAVRRSVVSAISAACADAHRVRDPGIPADHVASGREESRRIRRRLPAAPPAHGSGDRVSSRESGGSARRSLHPSLGDRSGATAHAGPRTGATHPLHESRTHGRTPAPRAERVSVRSHARRSSGSSARRSVSLGGVDVNVLALRRDPAPIVLVVGFLLLYAPLIPELVRDWSGGGDFSHGFLVPFVAAGLAWHRRAELRAAPRRAFLPGAALLVLSVVMYILGVAASEFYLQRSSMVAFLGGAAARVGAGVRAPARVPGGIPSVHDPAAVDRVERHCVPVAASGHADHGGRAVDRPGGSGSCRERVATRELFTWKWPRHAAVCGHS